MNLRGRLTSLLVASGLLCVAVGVVLIPGEAQAATRSVTGQYQYTCQVAESDKPSKKPILTSSMQLSIQLNVPTSVQAGQSVALRGTLSLQFPEELATYAKTLVDSANGYSDTITIALTMNGKTASFRADRWQTPNVKVSNPLVVRAPLTFPAFSVPSGSKGSIALAMPHGGLFKNPYFASPGSVAFTAAAQASGALLSANFYLACASSGTPPKFASIAIGGSASSPSDGSTTTAGLAANGAPTVSSNPSAAAANPFTDPAGSNAAAGSTTTATRDAGFSEDDRQGVYVPAGVLVVLGALVCGGSLAYAAWTQYRLRLLRSTLDD
ncbi:MAG: hypothetical protein JWQ70_1132 [Aeromicrobium sp.]|nr:hypothetical protein [Aeromicrobium sp.]